MKHNTINTNTAFSIFTLFTSSKIEETPGVCRIRTTKQINKTQRRLQTHARFETITIRTFQSNGEEKISIYFFYISSSIVFRGEKYDRAQDAGKFKAPIDTKCCSYLFICRLLLSCLLQLSLKMALQDSPWTLVSYSKCQSVGVVHRVLIGNKAFKLKCEDS